MFTDLGIQIHLRDFTSKWSNCREWTEAPEYRSNYMQSNDQMTKTLNRLRT